MKSILTISLTAFSIVNIAFALDFPKLERVSKQERRLGMPYLHDHPSSLLGNLHYNNDLLGCDHLSDTITLDENDPCHHRNIKL